MLDKQNTPEPNEAVKKPRFQIGKIYISKKGNLLLVDEKENGFVVYKLIPSLTVNKIQKDADFVFAKPAEQTVEDFLENKWDVDLNQ